MWNSIVQMTSQTVNTWFFFSEYLESGKMTTVECGESTDGLKCSWDLTTVIADHVKCEPWIVENVVHLLDDNNTIPFIARYRKEQTNFTDATKLREIKETLDELRWSSKCVFFLFSITTIWTYWAENCELLEPVSFWNVPVLVAATSTVASKI
jgi:Tex-like protein N-terminal domain